MNIEVRELTSISVMNEVAQATIHGVRSVSVSPEKWYRSEHSPIRARLFLLKLYQIPTFVSVHLVRHKYGVEHYVTSNRDDKQQKGNHEITRDAPVNHFMVLNAQAVISISRKRLCFKAHKKTVGIWNSVKKHINDLDNDLGNCLVPECIYRNGYCPEMSECAPGLKSVKKVYQVKEYS